MATTHNHAEVMRQMDILFGCLDHYVFASVKSWLSEAVKRGLPVGDVYSVGNPFAVEVQLWPANGWQVHLRIEPEGESWLSVLCADDPRMEMSADFRLNHQTTPLLMRLVGAMTPLPGEAG